MELPMSFRLAAICGLVALLPLPVQAQRKEATLLFKDGFRFFGKVIEKRETISDPTGAFVTIPTSGSSPYVDDQVRRMFFSYTQIQDVIVKKAEDAKDQMVLKRLGVGGAGDKILAGWE